MCASPAAARSGWSRPPASRATRRDREGVSVLMVEQNAAESLEVSDRAYVLVLGRGHGEGTAQEILEDETGGHLYLGAGPVH